MDFRELQYAVRSLTPEQLVEFASWFDEHLSDRWDEQIERDVQAGRLDKLVQQALADFQSGRCIPLDDIINRATS